MIDLISQIIQQVDLLKSKEPSEDEEMEDEQDGSLPDENLLKSLESLKTKKPEVPQPEPSGLSNEQLEQLIL